MRFALAAALSLVLATPAAAVMAPEYYDQARDEAANVIVIAVHEVEKAIGGIGWCTVHGIVDAVERGDLYQVGEKVAIDVECLDPSVDSAQIPVGGTLWQDMETLAKSHRGRAFLDYSGYIVLSQYEVLE